MPDFIRPDHRFGGNWTNHKLDVLAKYLAAYTTALKSKPTPARPFRKAYIDAFAGTGYRSDRRESEAESPQELLFPDLAEDAPQDLLDGSARRALQTDPPFDRYVFIERSRARCKQLETLKDEFPNVADRIDVKHGEANTLIQGICGADWRSHRAVIFLDPYGMQVEWKTIEAIASTKAIDLWLLFPLGMGVNRLLKRTGDIPGPWRRRLSLLLGNEAWYDEFYRVESSPTLFGRDEETVIKAGIEKIGQYFNDRLKEVFAGVAEKPGFLRNSSNSPLYLLCFAVGNDRGQGPALKIANHLLKGLQ